MIIEDILVELLNEGSSSYRPVKAEKIKENIYKIIVGQPYDTEDEKWEFEPGQIVEVGERILSEYSPSAEEKKKFKVAVRVKN